MAKTKDHGLTQYRYGCRCGICRAANTAKVREWRDRQRRSLPPKTEREPLPALVDVPAPVPGVSQGAIELALRAELGSLIGEPPWRGTLSAMLLANARVLDQVALHERYDIMSGLQTRTLEMLDRLRRVPEGGGAGVPADLSGLLGEPD